MTGHEIDYRELVDEALRSVVRRILERVVQDGLPGEHHFFISFRTDQDGVAIPSALRSTYPEVMTIVLQHQFWDLTVEDEAFEVSLRFGGRPSRLRIPWQAIRSFVDPEAEFGLRFGEEDLAALENEDPGAKTRARPEASGAVVSLDAFRQRDD